MRNINSEGVTQKGHWLRDAALYAGIIRKLGCVRSWLKAAVILRQAAGNLLQDLEF
jgi:hypothetical protein